jgi:hypothetical protein
MNRPQDPDPHARIVARLEEQRDKASTNIARGASGQQQQVNAIYNVGIALVQAVSAATVKMRIPGP